HSAMRPASAPAGDQPRAPHALPGAVAGMLAAAVAIGAAQFVAGLTAPASSPVLAVGQAAIDLTPQPVKDFAISAFGTADKTVLLGGILVVLALYAAVVGILAVRRLAFGMWGLGLFAFIGLWAALTRPGSTAAYFWPTLAGAAAGAFTLASLAGAAGRRGGPPGGGFWSAAGWPRPPRRPARSPGASWPLVATSPWRGTRSGSPGRRWPRRRCRQAATCTFPASARSSPPTTASTGSTPPCCCPRWIRRPGSFGSTGWCSGRSGSPSPSCSGARSSRTT